MQPSNVFNVLSPDPIYAEVAASRLGICPMTAIVTSIVVIAVVLVGVISFIVTSLWRRADPGTAGLDEAEGIIREAIATTAAPRAKARIVRHAA
jgi:hypothetical protein